MRRSQLTFDIYTSKKVTSSITQFVENSRSPFVVKEVVNKLHSQLAFLVQNIKLDRI